MDPAKPHEKRKVTKKLRALPPSDGSEDEVLGSFAIVSELSRTIEPAGHPYARLQGKFFRAEHRKLAADGGRDSKIAESDESEDPEDEKAVADSAEKAKETDYGKKRKTRTKEEIQKQALLMENLYAALGLEELSLEAKEGDISKAYKKMALRYHPDKLGEKYGEADKKIWLQVQKAYETLMDPEKRKRYDSTLPFDESIPDPDDITPENFYKRYAKTFDRNARFSVHKPVPDLGDENAPIE
jgi:hypothetical protein